MNSNADISGSFQRPGLVDYIVVAELLEADVDLRIWVGSLEVGLVGLVQGRVVHAELPGMIGDTALGLLARLPVRITLESPKPRDPSVGRPWRESIDERLSISPGRSQRLAAVRAEFTELGAELEQAEAAHGEFDSADVGVRRVVAELLDWAAIEAYLRGERERARVLLLERERAVPGDLLCAANRERLRLRLLEDEIEASVREAGA